MGVKCKVVDKPLTVSYEWKQGDLFVIDNKEKSYNPQVVWIVTQTIDKSICCATCLGDGNSIVFPKDFGKFIPITQTNILMFEKDGVVST